MSTFVHLLPAELLLLIFERLESYHDLCNCSKATNDEKLWESLLEQRYVDIPTERAEAQQLLETSSTQGQNKVIFANWFQRFRGFTDSYTRMNRTFRRLEQWAEENCPIILKSLGPGLAWVSGESIPVRELLQVVSDSPDMRDFIMAHHIHDGQRRRQMFLDHGLFGSYECYGEVCSLSWLGSRMLQVVKMGKFRLLIFAWCHQTRNYLGIVVACPMARTPHLMHHVIQLQPQSHRFVDHGLFGKFFASYVDNLVAGHHDVRDQRISLMPNCGPYTSSSLSHGIKTTVSAMFCVDETPRFRVYRYQVTFELIDPDQLESSSVQLASRNWLIYYTNQEYIHASGPGVVGEFPILSADRPFYRYCSRIEDSPEGMEVVGFEGQFTFVPGSLDRPAGPNITLRVPFIELPIPLEAF
ncbi:hypothetical protein LPJ79_004628 [Coemansia sp. RSA 1821]|nr:hypothetical protein LPJ79_004628 [Coemansia sp. RSA 1821]